MVIVRSGSWVYAQNIARPVDIVGLPFDFWHELAKADDQLAAGEAVRQLGEDGLLYDVRFRHAGETQERTWPDSAGYDTIEAAMRSAEARVPSEITWA